MKMLEPFPEVMALGRQRLQQLCDEWCRTPQATELSVSKIDVPADCRQLDFTLALHAKNYDKGDTVIFPLDRILTFISERCLDETQRQAVASRLRELREKVGSPVYQRYAVNAQAYTMAFRCPSCSHLLLSEHRIFEGQQFLASGFDPCTCNRCGMTFTPQNSDFFPVIDPDYPRDI